MTYVGNVRDMGFNDGRWKDRREQAWTIRAYWAEIDGRAECVGVGIWKGCRWDKGLQPLPGTEAKQLLATDLRDIPLSTLLSRLRKAHISRLDTQAGKLAELGLAAGQAGDDDVVDAVGRLVKDLVSDSASFGRKKSGRYAPEYWAQVAEVYTLAWRDGRDPTTAVKKFFGLKYSTAAKHVRRARDEGHLAQTDQGRAGGILPAPKPAKKREARR